MARTWFGKVCSCCSLTLLIGPAWVLLKYVLKTIFSGPVSLHLSLGIATTTIRIGEKRGAFG